MTHTPGPWIVDSSEKDTYVILKGLRYSDYVCKMSSENAQANAALIAAAPDLLAALECIVFEYQLDQAVIPDYVTAAIAKAKGC